jgi:PAS domain S-box-containing protein
MGIEKACMKQRETHLDNLFQEFQSMFSQASPEEKRHLAVQFYTWAQEQVDSMGFLTLKNDRGEVAEDRKYTGPTTLEAFQSNTHQDFISLDFQNLVESEFHLSQIAENLEQVFWLRDIHSGRILYVSPAFESVWGRSRESFYANPSVLIESVHPEDRVQVMVAKPHDYKTPFEQVYRILRPDHSLRWIFARTFLTRDESGETDCLFCIAQDVTDQKQVELSRRKTLDSIREQFNLSHKMSLARKPEAVLKILMSTHELHTAQRSALFFFDDTEIGPTGGVELLASWISSQKLSLSSNESKLYEEPDLWELLQPKRTMIITGIQSDPRLTPLVRDFLLEAQIQTLAIFPLVASRNWLGCLFVYYKKEHHFDHINLRHLKVLVDQAAITLYNLQLLEVAEESRQEAERANEIKTEFLAMISHELRTPLTSIIGFITTLLAEDVTWEPDEQRDFIHTIQREANRLQELIDHLLDLSRLEAGMLPISMEPYSLHEIIDDALPQFYILTNEQKFTLRMPASLPPIYVDAKRIAQVLVNLVRNASTYAPQGTEISISASVRGGFVQVNVNDEGPGIPPAERKKVFMAFRRGANVENDSTQGAGLGLAICKGLIEAHGGRIWIKKKTTPGTTICFTIPLVPLSNPVSIAEEER